MAKGQEFTRHQKKIIDRYYEHRDTIMLTKLSDLVSELYLCDSEKKADSLWKRVATALKNTDAPQTEIDHIMESRNLQALARLISRLTASQR
ncbi:MAG: hypothetical protein VYC34_06695 [Planctomycetota bacterium]|nr:hypothetical protein [Planctomycetota bacterium]